MRIERDILLKTRLIRWLWVVLLALVKLTLGLVSERIRSRRLGKWERVSQYDLLFRGAHGSEGHANVYVVTAPPYGTLVLIGQIADDREGARALENDHALASALGRLWLLSHGHPEAALARIYHYTADMDTGELVLAWLEGRVRGWQSFPYKLRYLSEIEDHFAVVLPDYCGLRPARRCGDPLPPESLAPLGTSIGCPVSCTKKARRGDGFRWGVLAFWRKHFRQHALPARPSPQIKAHQDETDQPDLTLTKPNSSRYSSACRNREAHLKTKASPSPDKSCESPFA